MVGRIIILFIVQHQRRPLLNDDKNFRRWKFWRGCFIMQQSKDGVHGVGEEENMKDGDLFEESSGDSITYEILIFSEILPFLFWWKCSTQLYWSKFIFYSLLALLYLNVQWRANSIWPMWLDESDGDNHFIVQGEWIGYLFKPSQLFWLFSKLLIIDYWLLIIDYWIFSRFFPFLFDM